MYELSISTSVVKLSNTFISIPIFGLFRVAKNNKYSGFAVASTEGANAQLNFEGSNTANSNNSGMSTSSWDSKVDVVINSGASLNLDQNSQTGYNVYKGGGGAELNVAVKENGSFQSCGHDGGGFGQSDIYVLHQAPANVTFTGSGYTCDTVGDASTSTGTFVKPVCQACPPE